MKKCIAVILALVMCGTLCACGTTEPIKETATTTTVADEATTETTEPITESNEEESEALEHYTSIEDALTAEQIEHYFPNGLPEEPEGVSEDAKQFCIDYVVLNVEYFEAYYKASENLDDEQLGETYITALDKQQEMSDKITEYLDSFSSDEYDTADYTYTSDILVAVQDAFSINSSEVLGLLEEQ